MKIKSSNSRLHIPILGMLVIVLMLLSFKALTTVNTKYAKTPKFNQETPLDFIQVTLKEKHFKKLKEKRNRAISGGVLETSDTDYVPATIAYNNKEYNAEVRLKGDWTDHLIGNKWSFRVKLKGDKTILGMRKFSLHTPKARNYVNEWLYHKAVKDEDLFGLRYGFLEGAIHIKLEGSRKYESMNVGIYAIEETFDKRTIESNRRKESIILKFSEDYWWNEVKKAIDVGYETGQNWNKFTNNQLDLKNNLPITVFSESKVIADSTMYNYFKLSKNLLEDIRQGHKNLDQVFDVKELAMQNAISNLFGAIHGSYIINQRYYYNPIISKLEPIAFDGNSGLKLKKYDHFLFVDQERDSVYLKELAFALNKVSQKEYIDRLVDKYQLDLDEYSKYIKEEFKVKGIAIQNLRYNQSILKQELTRLINKYNLNIKQESTLIVDSDNADSKIIKMPALSGWVKKGITLRNTKTLYKKDSIFTMQRKAEASYAVIPNISVIPQKDYKISLIVKRKTAGGYFGLRIQERFPSRADAIFDLSNGQLAEVSHSGDFGSSNAEIKPLGNGWYRCTLITKPTGSVIRLIFGPTSNEKTSKNWEGRLNSTSEVHVVPGSLSLERLTKD